MRLKVPQGTAALLATALAMGCPSDPPDLAAADEEGGDVEPRPPPPDPELPDRRALFQAAWGVQDYARPVTELYAALERGYLFVGRTAITEPGALLLTQLLDLHTHGLDPRAIDRDRLVADARTWAGGSAEARAGLELRLAAAMSYYLDHMGALLTLQQEPTFTWAKSRWRERTVRVIRHVDAGMPALPQWGPGYPALQAALLRYRAMPPLPPTPRVNRRRRRWLERGKRGPQVRVLARRLAAEGFLAPPESGEFSETFDATLEQGVRAYQRGHGIDPDGVVGPAVLRWLDRTPADKVMALRVAMRRARESVLRIGAVASYVRVNVPAFHLTAVEAGQPRIRMPLVVGSPKEKEDEDTQERSRPNATPLFQATITHLVWNPLWRVPERIKTEELDRHLMDDPNWYALNGYRLEIDPKSDTERAVQMPGPDNALGQLKVLFPNPYDVYLHDTPKRGLFGRARRAASHGCMRMKDPIALAQLLLAAGGQWNEREVERLLHDPKESEEFPKGLYERRWVKLVRPTPVYIDYQTVEAASGDLPGGVVFYEDLYELDVPYASRLAQEDQRLAGESTAR